jgi:hypothetical protein
VHEVARHVNVEELQQAAADRSGGDARRCFAGRGTLENVARIIAVVLEDPGQVRMSRAWARDRAAPLAWIALAEPGVHDLLPVRPVPVANEHGDRRSERLTRADAGEQLDGIVLDLHAPAAAVPLLAAGQVRVDISGNERHAGGHPLEDADERRPVGLAGGGEAEHGANCIGVG